MDRSDRHVSGRPFSGRGIGAYVGFGFLIGLLVLSGCQFRPQGQRPVALEPPTLAQPDTATSAPDFSRRTLDGARFQLSDHRGEVVVLNFWATWCAPCRAEILVFVKLQQRLADDGVSFVGVTPEEGPKERIRAFVRKFNVNDPIIRGGPRLLRKYGEVSTIPTTYVIDARGRIQYGHVGLVPSDKLDGVLHDLLAEKTDAPKSF